MLARTATILKWALYALAAILCLLIQGAVLQRITVWGVIRFLYPLLAAIPATDESPRSAAISYCRSRFPACSRCSFPWWGCVPLYWRKVFCLRAFSVRWWSARWRFSLWIASVVLPCGWGDRPVGKSGES